MAINSILREQTFGSPRRERSVGGSLRGSDNVPFTAYNTVSYTPFCGVGINFISILSEKLDLKDCPALVNKWHGAKPFYHSWSPWKRRDVENSGREGIPDRCLFTNFVEHQNSELKHKAASIRL